jgi:hypothetical protein
MLFCLERPKAFSAIEGPQGQRCQRPPLCARRWGAGRHCTGACGRRGETLASPRTAANAHFPATKAAVVRGVNARHKSSFVKMSSLVPMRRPAAAEDLQVGAEHQSAPERAPQSPASRSTLRGASIPRLALSIVDVPGTLLWTGVLALAGGAWIHASVDRLPQAYSWLLPFRTLRNVMGEASFPLWALLAFAMGRAQARGWRSIAESLRQSSVRWRSSRLGGLLAGLELRYRVAALVAVAVLLLDGLAFPAHAWIDSLAMSMAAFVAVSRATRRSSLRAVLDVAVGVLVFAAVCYWLTVVKTLTFASRVQWDAAIANFEKALFGVYPHRWAAAIFARHPSWLLLMDGIYLSIFEHMAVATSFLLGVGDARERDRYLGALCFCYVIGLRSISACQRPGPSTSTLRRTPSSVASRWPPTMCRPRSSITPRL